MSREILLDNEVLKNAIFAYDTAVRFGDSDALTQITAELLKELQKYRDAEEQGLLLRLPCKVGTPYFEVTTHFWDDITKCENCKYFYEGSPYAGDNPWCEYENESRNNGKPKECLVIVEGCFLSIEYIIARMKDFGKTVFLTKEEAEQALAKMDGKEEGAV